MASKIISQTSASRATWGFTLIELMPSVAILSLLMAAVLGFMSQVQKRYQGSQVTSESSQSARAALEVLTQDIGQAGYNPNFPANKTISSPILANADAQCVTLSDLSRINPGDWISVDTGINSEQVQVTGTTNNGVCAQPNQIQGVFELNHVSPASAFPIPVNSYKLSYPGGILVGTGMSDDHDLFLFGDVNDDGVINYVTYTLQPTTTPPTRVTLQGIQYTLFNLMRSVTPVTFAAGAVRNPASPMVQNVLYQDFTSTTNPTGPMGQPIFSFPQMYVVGIVPNLVTVVGTVNVNLSVAVNPQSLETQQLQWFTMATRIRPLNLASAVQVAQAGGFRFLPPLPAGLPMP